MDEKSFSSKLNKLKKDIKRAREMRDDVDEVGGLRASQAHNLNKIMKNYGIYHGRTKGWVLEHGEVNLENFISEFVDKLESVTHLIDHLDDEGLTTSQKKKVNDVVDSVKGPSNWHV